MPKKLQFLIGQQQRGLAYASVDFFGLEDFLRHLIFVSTDCCSKKALQPQSVARRAVSQVVGNAPHGADHAHIREHV